MIDLKISLGNVLTACMIGGGVWFQTVKLGRWQGRVDAILATLVDDMNARRQWNGTERRV